MTLWSKADPSYSELSFAFGFLGNIFFPSLFLFRPLFLLGEPETSTHPVVRRLWAASVSSEAAEMFLPGSVPPPRRLGLSHSHPCAQQSEVVLKPLILAAYLKLAVSQSHGVRSRVSRLQIAGLLMLLSDNTPALW